MSSEQERKTIIIPLNLGSPSQYDQSIFPLMKMKRMSSLDQVDIVLEATMDELFKIHEMAGDLKQLEAVFVSAKKEYDKLKLKKEGLENQKTSFNPLKVYSTYRSTRLLAVAGKKLYKQARSTSEKLRRQLLSVNRQDIQPVEYADIPPDAQIGAIAIPLESPLDESTATHFTEAADFIASQVNLLPDGNPFGDDQEVEVSAFDSGTPETEAKSSAGSRSSGAFSGQWSGNDYFVFNNSNVASRSSIQSQTLNHGGSHNQGSSPRY
ncbi:uncharacterized protein EDB93DRAFT_1144317 [Suillus bovinus]|uniref:uncharacterized protein n=1 Tax=Suillus bovinus TaxID=48563 RepID=UPI001B8730CB|nr:uncharacterized protein EDB93DRAFT_1144317 [Suillus bovinus]KAG2148694.1 hypothetical protein EDB93DRAFT_1144317 [Suillus bovinus]